MNENQDPVLDPIQGQPTGQPEFPATEPAPFGGQYGAQAWNQSDIPAYEEANAYAQPSGDDAYAPSYGETDPYGQTADPYVIHAEPPKKKHTGLILGLGCLLLALLAAGGWWLLNNRSADPLKQLKSAASKSMDSYLDYIKDLPNLHQCMENQGSFIDSDAKRIDLNVSLEGIPQVPDMNIQVGLNLDGTAHAALLHGSYVSDEMTIPVDLYVDKDQIQIGSSALLDEGEVYALPMKDLGKKWNASPFGGSAKMPEDMSLSFLTEGLSEQDMIDTFGEDWTAFMDSVTYRKATEEDGKDPFTAKGETYVLVWDQTLLEKLGKQAKNNVDTWTKLSKLEHVYPTFAVGFLSTVSREIEAPKFRVADGMLVGVSIQEKNTDHEKGVAVMELLGETNPWSRCQMTVTDWNSDTQKMETILSQESTMTVADGKLSMKTVQKDADGKETLSMEVVYTDADGSYTMSMNGSLVEEGSDYPMMGSGMSDMMGSLLQNINMHMLPIDGGVKVEESIDLSTIPTFSMYSIGGKFNLTMELSTKTEAVQPLSAAPKQLLEMDMNSLQALVMRLMQKLQGFNVFA